MTNDDDRADDRRTVPGGPLPVTAAVRTRRLERPARSRFAVVGSGWRSTAYLRLGRLLPEVFEATGVLTRRAESAERVEREYGVPTARTLDELLARDRPDFVVLSVPWPVTPELTRALVAAGTPVLAETPPAPDADGMRSLWADIGAAGLVQVAEQYPFMPLHAARLALTRQGVVGTAGSVQVSSTHLYHVVALMRALLDVGREPATVQSRTFTAPLVDPITPDGWTHDATERQARTILSTIDFGDARSGLYDFTENQWWNPLRPDHLTVRGSTGEIHDESVVRLLDAVTPITSRIERAVTGTGMDYQGVDLTHLSFEGRAVFVNRFQGAGLSDDEIGTAELLARTGAWARGEAPGPYPLADGMHDHLVGLAIEESARTGAPVRTDDEPWSRAR